MTAHEVRLRVAEIEAAKGDPEAAHDMEDKLLADVLKAIAERRCLIPAAVAREALRSLQIDFPRWTE